MVKIQRLASCGLLGVALISAAQAADRFSHAEAHNPGVNDTMWLTDAQVFDPDAARSIEVRLAFLEDDHRNRPQSEVGTIRGWISAGARNN